MKDSGDSSRVGGAFKKIGPVGLGVIGVVIVALVVLIVLFATSDRNDKDTSSLTPFLTQNMVNDPPLVTIFSKPDETTAPESVTAPETETATPAPTQTAPPDDSSEPDTVTEPPVVTTEEVTTEPEPIIDNNPNHKKLPIADLKDDIEEMISQYPGEWSCYMQNLDTGEKFTINDHVLYPASMIKLFALCASYEKIYAGEIDENAYNPYMYNMAVMSNNQAFNAMVWAMGPEYITQWCEANGLPNTKQYHGLQPSTNYEGLAWHEGSNQTCASDVGHCLEMIYRGKCVNEEASEKILDMLGKQHWRGKIPAGIPYGVFVANKTGDTYDVSHDAAIVESPCEDYILVLMCECPDIAFDLNYYFAYVSQYVYNYFNS